MKYERREKKRDDRDFDTTSLRAAGSQGSNVSRDYSAHFFRWAFAKRMIQKTDRVLEVGCGPDVPLQKLLFRNMMPYAAFYVGTDLNPLPKITNQHVSLHEGFDFTKRWGELKDLHGPFDVAVHLEVIEHMKVEHGRKMLKGIFSLLKPGGLMIMSTPVYDGVRHAANHIHEYTIEELDREVRKAGFVVEKRYGTFMDVKEIKKARALAEDLHFSAAVRAVYDALAPYYSNDHLACFFAPLYPDHARNNLWLARKPA